MAGRAPFITIIGLYSNVPEGGRLDDQQISWLRAELAAAPRDAILLVTMHHPLYSADAGTDLTLENYVANRHGYLRLTASSQGLRSEYVTVPRPQESWHKGPTTIADSFTINLGR